MTPKMIQVGHLRPGKGTNDQAGRIYCPHGIAPCLYSHRGGQHEPKFLMCKMMNIEERKVPHIRKFTPRECFRLMDVDDNSIDKIQQATVQTKNGEKPAIPKTQQIQLAGNSIVVSCLYYVFKNLFINQQYEQLTLFDKI